MYFCGVIKNIKVMILNIEPFDALPCCLRVFEINGKTADYEDFGVKAMDGGSCMDNACGCTFYSEPPTQETLKKYGINEEEYNEICEKLESVLHVFSCGWCS